MIPDNLIIQQGRNKHQFCTIAVRAAYDSLCKLSIVKQELIVQESA